jgi:hypothetical protein
MKLKPGVKLTDLVPQMVLAARIIEGVYDNYRCECVITSGNDSKHGANSLHYKGRALDFRTKNYAGDKRALRDEIKEALGDDFDVILEDLGGVNEHIHTEYEPK